MNRSSIETRVYTYISTVIVLSSLSVLILRHGVLKQDETNSVQDSIVVPWRVTFSFLQNITSLLRRQGVNASARGLSRNTFDPLAWQALLSQRFRSPLLCYVIEGIKCKGAQATVC